MTFFSKPSLLHFHAEAGAFSVVTTREATGDKSVTVDSAEKSVLHTRYSANSFHRAGGAADDGKSPTKNFYVYNPDTKNFEQHTISIKRPKATGQELRLYFKRDTNFYPTEHQVWFIFTRKGDPIPYIGSMDRSTWDNISSGEASRIAFEQSYQLDEEDESYQKAIQSPIAISLADIDNPRTQNESSQYLVTSHKRDAGLAAKCALTAKFRCENNEAHETFISASSDKPYVEVHHLVPISQTEKFNVSLDVPANLVVLCPNCHRAFHFGNNEVKRNLISKFYSCRIERLNSSGINISLENLMSLYGVKSS